MLGKAGSIVFVCDFVLQLVMPCLLITGCSLRINPQYPHSSVRPMGQQEQQCGIWPQCNVAYAVWHSAVWHSTVWLCSVAYGHSAVHCSLAQCKPQWRMAYALCSVAQCKPQCRMAARVKSDHQSIARSCTYCRASNALRQSAYTHTHVCCMYFVHYIYLLALLPVHCKCPLVCTATSMCTHTFCMCVLLHCIVHVLILVWDVLSYVHIEREK